MEGASEGTSMISHCPVSWVRVTVGLSGMMTCQEAKYMCLVGSALNAFTPSRGGGGVVG